MPNLSADNNVTSNTLQLPYFDLFSKSTYTNGIDILRLIPLCVSFHADFRHNI